MRAIIKSNYETFHFFETGEHEKAKMKKATIKDVCKMTGLSLGTVSKYLNGGNLREANREKIGKAIEKLGYHVDEYARGFITNRTKTVGVLLPEFDNLFYARIVSAMELELSRSGYAVTVRESNRDVRKERESVRWFITRRIDALVIVPCGKSAQDYEYLKEVSIPVVFLDHYMPGVNCEFVLVDNREVCRKSVNYLLDCGHRKIAIVGAPQGVYTSDERMRGYKDAFEEHGLQADESLCYHVEENVDSAYLLIKKILSEKRCTALFTSNFPNTCGAIFAVNEMHICIPGELSLLGFDDMMFTRVFNPRLTIVDQPIGQIAELTVSRLMEHLQKKVYDYRVNVLACNFEINDSTAVLE